MLYFLIFFLLLLLFSFYYIYIYIFFFFIFFFLGGGVSVVFQFSAGAVIRQPKIVHSKKLPEFHSKINVAIDFSWSQRKLHDVSKIK